MSRENVETMRRGIELWNGGDLDVHMDFVQETVHPDMERFAVIAQLVEGQETVYRGISGMRRFWEDWHKVLVLSRVAVTAVPSTP